MALKYLNFVPCGTWFGAKKAPHIWRLHHVDAFLTLFSFQGTLFLFIAIV